MTCALSALNMCAMMCATGGDADVMSHLMHRIYCLLAMDMSNLARTIQVCHEHGVMAQLYDGASNMHDSRSCCGPYSCTCTCTCTCAHRSHSLLVHQKSTLATEDHSYQAFVRCDATMLRCWLTLHCHAAVCRCACSMSH